MSIYALKPKFQSLLRPIVQKLASSGYTANQVTLFAFILSILTGIFLCITSVQQQFIFLLILPLWMFIRMALNAIDGMLAREHHQQTPLGGYLNELTDVVADGFLFLPFYWALNSMSWLIWVVIILSILTEFAGVLGQVHGNSRRYDGPMGKSDRALAFSLICIVIAAYSIFDFGLSLLSQICNGILIIIILLLAVTIFNRIKNSIHIPE